MANGAPPFVVPGGNVGIGQGIGQGLQQLSGLMRDLAGLKMQEKAKKDQFLFQHELRQQEAQFAQQAAVQIQAERQIDLKQRADKAIAVIKGSKTPKDPATILEAMAEGGFITAGSFAPLLKQDSVSETIEALRNAKLLDIESRTRTREAGSKTRTSKGADTQINQLDDNISRDRTRRSKIFSEISRLTFGAPVESLDPSTRKAIQNLRVELGQVNQSLVSANRRRNKLVGEGEQVDIKALEDALKQPVEEEALQEGGGFDLVSFLKNLGSGIKQGAGRIVGDAFGTR